MVPFRPDTSQRDRVPADLNRFTYEVDPATVSSQSIDTVRVLIYLYSYLTFISDFSDVEVLRNWFFIPMIPSTTVLLLQIVIIPFSRCVSVVKTIFVCSKLSKMELRFDIQILLICLWNFASTLASDVGADLWGIEQCRDAGFSSANLLCSSCKGEARVVYLCVSLHFVHSTQSHAFEIYPFSQIYLNLG